MAWLMGFNTDLMTGQAELFQSNGIGVFATGGILPADSVGIFLGLTPDKPDRAVTLMTYPVEDTDLSNVIAGLQIRLRGARDPRQVEDTSDAIYDLLHNRSHYDVNGIHVLLSWRQSGAWMGQDANQRIERVENYYIRAERTAPHKLP